MKKILLVLAILLLISGLIFARTTTTDLGLVLPTWDEEDPEYDILVDLIANWNILEALANDPLEFDTGERLEDRAGAMWIGNTETGITVTYQDGDNTIDAVIGADDIVQTMLKCVNEPIDEDIFTYESTTGDFEWHTLAELSIQPLDATLTALAGLTISANSLIYGTGADAFSILATNATATNKFLREVSSGAPSWEILEAGDIPDISATYQPLDTALTNISALTYASPSFIKLTADDTYAVRTLAEVKTDLAYQLSDMSDVGVTTPTDKYVLMADGDSWESRALVEADISDLGAYITDITGGSIFDLSDVSVDPNADKYPMWDDDPGQIVWVDAPSGGYTNLTSFVAQTAWRLFYSNADGDVTELALGTDTQVLTSNGVDVAPAFEDAGGAGETNTASNIGTGADVYSAKDGVDLEFRKIEAGSDKVDIDWYTEGNYIEQETFTTTGNERVYVYSVTQAAQVFTAASSYDIKRVILYIRCNTASESEDDFHVEIKAIDGSGHPTGSALASGLIAKEGLNLTWAWETCTFSEITSLTSGTQYAIVCSAPSSTGSNPYEWKYVSAGGFSGGNSETSSDSGSSWTSQTYDQLFKNYSIEVVYKDQIEIDVVPSEIAPEIGGLLSTTTVSFAADADTTLYTVPTGKRCVLTHAIVVAVADAGATTTFSIGANGTETDFIPANTLSNLDAQYDSVILQPIPNTTPLKIKSYAAATVIEAQVASQSGAAGNTIYLFGITY